MRLSRSTGSFRPRPSGTWPGTSLVCLWRRGRHQPYRGEFMRAARDPSPSDREAVVVVQRYVGAEPRAFAVQNAGQPGCVLSTCAVQPEPADLERREFEVDKPAARDIQPRKVQQSKFATKLLVPDNALVVVDEIAAAVKDRSVAIDFDRFGMMRRMTMDHRKAGNVDQPMRETNLAAAYLITPIPTPVDRGYLNV